MKSYDPAAVEALIDAARVAAEILQAEEYPGDAGSLRIALANVEETATDGRSVAEMRAVLARASTSEDRPPEVALAMLRWALGEE